VNDPQQPRPSASDVADDYDRIADEYARRLYAELDAKPFDRTILDRFAALVGNGRVCEVGCGPGHVSRYLRDRGCDVFGIDLSPRMVELAAELNPEIEFQVGDLRALDLADSTLAGVVAFYSLIHLRPDDLSPALVELRRVLRPGGRVLLAVHEGAENRRPGEMWGIRVDLEFTFFSYDQLSSALRAAHFAIEEITHRAPDPEVEVATDRLYALAVAAEADR
jgi:SAM-dependent methyltransferase